ncbi:MAG: Hpt domain-containing protein [Burkholderiales bacterium]|nr:Hpt domain-containing protein [Burkholderiales bacterium]
MDNAPPAAVRESVRVARELSELVPRFLAHRRADADRLREALERADFDTVRSIGHAMKGAGAGYGFEEITTIGAELERVARVGDPAAGHVAVNRLRDFLDRVHVVFE